MPLTLSTTPNESWPANSKVTLDRLRRAAKPTITLSGNVDTDNLTDGAVTTAKTKPGAFFYVLATGTDAITITLTPAPVAALVDGVVVRFKANSDKTSVATLTITGCTPTARPIRKRGGGALDANDIRDKQLVEVVYNSTLDASGCWEILAPVGDESCRYALDTGTTDSYIVTLSPALIALVKGMVIRFKAKTANTGACTLQVNTPTPASKAIRKYGNLELADGDILSGQYVEVVYTEEDTFFLLSPIAPANLYAADAGSTDAYVVNIPVFLSAYYAGLVVRFKANTANTGTCTLALTVPKADGTAGTTNLGNIEIKKRATANLNDGDIRAGQIVEVVYDGTYFQLIGDVGGGFTSAQLAVPAAGGAVPVQTHGLGAVPQVISWVMVCTDALGDAGYVLNDEVPIENFFSNASAPLFYPSQSLTSLELRRCNVTDQYVGNKTTGAQATTVDTKWRLKVYARL